MIQHDTLFSTAKSSVLLSSEHMELVTDVINKLQDAVNLATNDFLLVAALIRNLGDRSKLNNAFHFGTGISHVITELQYIDALKQRIDHMIFFMEEINVLKQPDQRYTEETINNYQKTCGLIFQLNYYQLKVAKVDFIKSVEKIKSELIALKAKPGVSSQFDVEPKEIFACFRQVIKNIQGAASRLAHLSASFPVNSEVRSLGIIRQLLNRYTMESEREVLRWCINYLEDSSIAELAINDSKEDQIQLF